jgi:hypothetical protein
MVVFDGSVVSEDAATALLYYSGRFTVESGRGQTTVRLEGHIVGVPAVG